MDQDRIVFKKKTFLGAQGELVNNANFQAYLAKNGEDQAIAYLQALNDFTRQLEVILGGGFVRNGFTTTGKKLQKRVENLVDHNVSFLKSYTNDGEDIKLQLPTPG